MLTGEEITKNREVVHDHADIPDQGVVVGGAGMVVGVVVLTVVMPATSPASSACQLGGARRGDCYGPENPTSHKSNTNNFGPHRWMFLSIDVNRAHTQQEVTFMSSSQMEEIDQLEKLEQQWVP